MPTKNERLSLVTAGEEVTAVKAPPPGLIRESKVVAVPGAGPITTRVVDLDDSAPTPAPVFAAASAPATMSSRGNGRMVLDRRATPVMGRPLSATLLLSQPPVPAPAAAPLVTYAPLAPLAPRSTPALARVSTPVPIPPALVASYQRPVVDLVPVSPGAGAIAFAPPALTFRAPSSARSRVGLYAVLFGLLAGVAGLVGWRQWSARPAHVEITTVPPDAIITVGSEPVAQHSPYTLERSPGSYQISVAREGYQHTQRTVTLSAGQQVTLAIALTANDAAGAPITAAVVPMAPPASGPAAARHAQGGGARSPAARRAPVAVAAATPQPDPGIAAMLARSHPLRDLAGAPSAEPAPAPAAEATAPEAPTAAAAAPAAASASASASADEVAPAAVPVRAAAAAPAAPAPAAPLSPEISGARTVPGRVAKAQLTIDPNAAEYRVALPPSLARAEMKLAAVVKVCVSAQGRVADVKVLKSADPAVDAQIPLVLSRWRFRPLLAGGRAVPFCYVTQYEIGQP